MYEKMDRERRLEIDSMRVRSGRMTRDYQDHMTGINPGIFLLFRCFLAVAFFVTGVVFPMISDSEIPKELKELPEYISVNYTMDEVVDFMDSMAN